MRRRSIPCDTSISEPENKKRRVQGENLEAVMNLRAAENFRYLGIGLRYRD